LSQLQKIFATLQGVKNQAPEITAKIDAVLLHVRARQLENQKNLFILISVFAHLFIEIFGLVFSFILFPFVNTISFIACVAFSVLVFLVADEITLSGHAASVCAYMLAYTVTNLGEIVDFFRIILFDFLDILFLGVPTKKIAKFFKNSHAEGCEIMMHPQKLRWYRPKPFPSLFYVSRWPYQTIRELAETESKFVNIARSSIADESILEMCLAYWRDFEKAESQTNKLASKFR
jgi:hypothetical protein